jgi:hypothetical protein
MLGKISSSWTTMPVHRFPQILLERLAESEYCWSVYANEQSDTLLDRPLSDKARPHVTYSQPTQLRPAHILCLVTDITLFGVGS